MTESTEKPTIYKGLVGVYADVSAVSKVMPETNSLTYRGYAVQDLARIPAGELHVLNLALPPGTLLEGRPGIF